MKRSNHIKLARLLRQDSTEVEKVLWELLRDRKINGLKFRRQHPLKGYIVDFFCYELKLIIELDGGYHNHPEQKEKDEIRDLHLKALGYKVLRFSNTTVSKEPKVITETIAEYKSSKVNRSAPLSVGRGAGGEGKSILSTKKLTSAQKNLILGAGFSVVEYDAIQIEFLDVEFPKNLENLIFTSKNGVQAFLNTQPDLNTETFSCFCVGSKTESSLIKKGFKVVRTAQNAADLADFIVKNHKNAHFSFFCSAIRRDELPEHLTKNQVSLEEVVCYKTQLNTQEFKQEFDAVLFFSPSGVQSFSAVNHFKNMLSVCIGNTTAAEVQKHTQNVTVANATTIESVIARAVKALN